MIRKTDTVLKISERERGNAIIEYIVLMALLVIPLFYLIVCLASVQATVFASEAASRSAARILATNPSLVNIAHAQAELTFADYKIRSPYTLDTSCVPADCLGLDAYVSVTTSTNVPLPFMPAWFGHRGFIPVSSTSEAAIEIAAFDE